MVLFFTIWKIKSILLFLFASSFGITKSRLLFSQKKLSARHASLAADCCICRAISPAIKMTAASQFRQKEEIGLRPTAATAMP